MIWHRPTDDTDDTEAWDPPYPETPAPRPPVPPPVRDPYADNRLSAGSAARGSLAFRAGWPQRIAPPGLPRIRTCPLGHTARHVMSSPRDGTPSRIRRDPLLFRGHVHGFRCIRRVSLQRCHDMASPSLHGVPRMVPPVQRYYGTLRLPAVRLSPLRVLHEPIPPFLGLNHTTFDLAVYASQDGLPHHHARLASGCWSSSTRRDSYPQGFNERFPSSSSFLLSKALLTQ